MKMLTLTATLLAGIASAHAQSPSCKVQATEKKLAGAALTSFMKKCERDATTACNTSAAEKKLGGAAKTSFVKKCVNDAVGTQ
ncbi:MAG: PsiF family protein [Xanthobacteraceae bacterium]